MTARSNIEWTDSTFNHWEGCTKVGPGCDHCYAETRNARFGGGQSINWGPGAPRRLTSEHNRNNLRRWNRKPFYQCACGYRGDATQPSAEGGSCCPVCQGQLHAARRRVFCSSLSDVFDNEVPQEWRDALFAEMEAAPNLDFLVLTKRIGNARKMVPPSWRAPRGWPAHVWLGATIVNQDEADRDIEKLLALPARVHFLSMEPLLAPVDLSAVWVPNGILRNMVPAIDKLDWVIVGGESGAEARPMHPDWVRSLRDQCEAVNVPMLFKQWGEWADMSTARITTSGPVVSRKGDVADWMHQAVTFNDGTKAEVRAHSWTGHATDLMYRIGKKAAGRVLDGRTWDGFPIE